LQDPRVDPKIYHIAEYNTTVNFNNFSYLSRLILVKNLPLKDFPHDSQITHWKKEIKSFIADVKSLQETALGHLDKEIFDEYILLYLCNINAHRLGIE
jgi:hypothetical protein